MNKTELNIVLCSEPARMSPNSVHSHIPVPKISNATKQLERSSPKRGNMFERLGRSTVAAHKASFEQLDASVQLRSRNNNNLSTSTIDMRNEAKGSFHVKRNESPVSKLNRSNSFVENKWKSKFEDSEKKRKLVIQKNEAVNKEHAELENKYQQVQKQNCNLQCQVEEKEKKLLQLRTVSEAMCKEYEKLKHQYDIETGAMHKAMQQASQWYKQNRELKRRSQIIAQKLQQVNPGIIDIDLSDEVDSNSEDTDRLRETVKELSQEMAKLQTDLNSARLQEFEAQEQITLLTTQLEEERILRQKGDDKIKELEILKENMERMTKKIVDEVQALKTQCDRERENAKIIKLEADKVQKERNVLAHQSAVLLSSSSSSSDERLLLVLQEMESLKRSLEDQQQDYSCQIQNLMEKLEEKESNIEFEIVEEKLKMAETELNMAECRAERAEKVAEDLENVVKQLKEKVEELEKKVDEKTHIPLPPPLPPIFNNDSKCGIKLVTGEKNADKNVVRDMQNMLGIKKSSAVTQQPAIDDIINQIKGGRFTLKQTDKQREEERRRKQEAESAPPAVSEMLNILGTMRRKAKPVRQTFKFPDAAT